MSVTVWERLFRPLVALIVFTHAHTSPLLVISIQINDTFMMKGGVILILPNLNDHVIERLGEESIRHSKVNA